MYGPITTVSLSLLPLSPLHTNLSHKHNTIIPTIHILVTITDSNNSIVFMGTIVDIHL